MTPDPPPMSEAERDRLHALAREWGAEAHAKIVGPLVAEICNYIRNWGGAPPDPHGKRARLAADIAMRFGVIPEAGQ